MAVDTSFFVFRILDPGHGETASRELNFSEESATLFGLLVMQNCIKHHHHVICI